MGVRLQGVSLEVDGGVGELDVLGELVIAELQKMFRVLNAKTYCASM